MSLTFKEAVDDMLTMFKTAWDTTGHQAFYDNIRLQRETDNSPWADVVVRHATGQQDTLGGVGNRSFLREGSIMVGIHTLATSGLSTAYALAKTVVDAYEGVASPNGVWFRNVRIIESDVEETFNHLMVIIDFEYYELK